MLKAYMSDVQRGGEWWRYGQGSIPQWDLQAQAIREAARILAETERGACVHRALPMPLECVDALAESLAAFIAAPVPE